MAVINLNDSTPAAPGVAGSVNIKFQNDGSGNISGYWPVGNWQAWTPTFVGSGIMTITPSTVVASYLRTGPIVYIAIRVAAVTASTADITIVCPNLPVPALTTAAIQHYSITGGAVGPAGPNAWKPIWSYVNGTDGKLYLYWTDGTVWPIGLIGFNISGYYRCA